MTGKEIYTLLSCCGYFKIEKKIYTDWVKTEKSLIGFEAIVSMKWEKFLILNKIKDWCADRGLPVLIKNINSHPARFIIKIIK